MSFTFNLPEETEILSGEITAIRYHDPASGFFVASLRRGTDEIAVVGSTIFLAVGAHVTVAGQWVDHARYGRQFKATSIALADQASAMQTLLGSGFLRGVKAKMAQQIARTFGPDTFSRLDQAIDDPNSLRVVKGIGPVNCRWIVESWQAERHWAQAALVSIRAGLTMRQAKEAHRRFGPDLPAVINDNPYLLTVVHGVTWQRADEIAALEWPGKAKIGHDDPRRYAAAVREALRQAYQEGHMALTETDALERAARLARPAQDGFADKVRMRYPDEYLLLQGEWLYMLPYYEIERDTAERIAQMLTRPMEPVGDWSQIAADLDAYAAVALSPDQVQAVQVALASRLLVITGGPGTGKTTLANTICTIMAEHGLSLTLCAPTGKAARRMAEATGRPAATIHRTLGMFGDGEAQYSFLTDVVIADESSMIDASLMRQVVSACSERTRLIFIGDVDQLPPVGAGEPFYQIIQSGVPVVRLVNIHRQGRNSGIIWAAHGFNAGVVADVTPFADIEIAYAPSNAALPNDVLKKVGELVRTDLTIRDVQVLTPLNQHPWGQHALNLRLQEVYNPGPFPLKGCPFKPGDKVIHTKNVYNMRKQTVLNGMTGMVQWVATDEYEKELDAQRLKAGIDELPVILWVYFEGESKPITYTREELSYLKLAYAMTIHKSQGSEYNHVVLAIPSTHQDFMLRQLAYTGLTRAKQHCVIISAQSALQTYVQNEERVRRITFLGEMIQQNVAAAAIATQAATAAAAAVQAALQDESPLCCPDELFGYIDRIDDIVAIAIADIDLNGFKNHVARAIRLDLASQALSELSNYKRKIYSYNDLTRGELAVTETWLATTSLTAVLTRLGWLPIPTSQRIAQLLKENPEIPQRTRQKLIERFIDGR